MADKHADGDDGGSFPRLLAKTNDVRCAAAYQAILALRFAGLFRRG
jgi:hypothetical protein